ncbi:hypothetical protein [Bacillus sp. X1(2014)]|uniref:hypothetical protein n=1 Tax=Bacillus sp. X1(2014) TaxID=1565991 RepID=UPI0011A6C854|nr:hypothetical protein [Bacillus sp. X1(2014)]
MINLSFKFWINTELPYTPIVYGSLLLENVLFMVVIVPKFAIAPLKLAELPVNVLFEIVTVPDILFAIAVPY